MITVENPQPDHSPRLESAESSSRFLGWSVAVFLLCFVLRTLQLAYKSPFWMDEILSLWAMRLPSVSQVYAALAHGSEFSPPGYLVFLHFYAHLAGYSTLALRLPSIAAALAAGLFAFTLLRRYIGAPGAALALCLLLEPLHPYAIQVRPYTFMTAFFFATLLVWDDYNRKPAWWRAVLITLLLALAISFHFYAVLFLPGLGMIELIYSREIRKFRPAVWAAMIAAGASMALWLPLMHAASHFNQGDSASPAYYAKPTFSKLNDAYCQLSLDSHYSVLLLLATFLILLVLWGTARQNPARRPREEFERNFEGKQDAAFPALLFGTLLFPAFVFAFSMVVSKTFNQRYVLAGAFGFSALTGWVFSRMPNFRRGAPFVALVAAGLTLGSSSGLPPAMPTATLFEEMPGNYPVVLADGLQFFPLEQSAPAAIRARLVYLTLPPDAKVGDPTNEHQIERWKAINPALPVEDITEFLRTTPKFYVLDQQRSDDSPLAYLLSRHLIHEVRSDPGALIYESNAVADGSGQ